MVISNKQKENIRKFIGVFKEYTKTDQYTKDLEVRKGRERFFKSINKNTIKNLTEFEFGEIVSNLWASQFWGNKGYLINTNIISKNGMNKIRKELFELFFGTIPLEKRYENFIEEVHGLGPASVTEMLCILYPTKCAIWNDKARKASKILGFEGDLPVNKYQISAQEYKKFNTVINDISQELKTAGFDNSDLFFVDYYLYEVQTHGEYKEKPSEKDFDHFEIRDLLRDIGQSLGFESETEKQISHGTRVDVVWKTKIGNLGTINYVFEVQRKGSINKLIVNLQKALKNKTVQKVIAVSDEKQIEDIKKHVNALPESNFREAITFWEVSDVKQMYEHLSEANRIIEKIGLRKDEFAVEK